MTFLELCKKLRQKVGGPGTGPSTVISQTGESKDFVDWINEAWVQIQAEETNWKWMRKDVSFQTVAGQIAYVPSAMSTPVTDLAMWHQGDTWRCYNTSIGRADESFLVPWEYQIFRDTYDFGLQSEIQSKPCVYAVRDSDQAILLGNTPDGIYTITGQYQAAPTELALDADVPGMPLRFHLAIVYRAMVLYGRYEAAPEVEADGQREYNKLKAALRIDQLETLRLGGPLA